MLNPVFHANRTRDRNMTFLRRIRRDERGANAIEYALIAGLIGIGLIGSLVTTRGSLSAIFGVASSKMASSDAGTGSSGGGTGGSTAQANPAFANKTLTNRTSVGRVWGATQYDYTYSDGSTATYYTASAYRGSYYNANATMTDAATGKSYTYLFPQTDTVSGQAISPNLSVVDYYPSGNQKTYTSYSFNNDGVSLYGTQRNYPDQAGASQTSTASVTAMVSTFQTYIDQANAYKALP